MAPPVVAINNTYNRLHDRLLQRIFVQTRTRDPDQTQTEIFTAYWIKVFLPDSDDTWVVEKRFQAFKTLRSKLLADDNPAIRSTKFPVSTALGSITGQGLDVEVVHTRKRLLEDWLNEALLVCCGDADLAAFLDRSQAIPDAELNIPDDFEIVMVNPSSGLGDLYAAGSGSSVNVESATVSSDEDSSSGSEESESEDEGGTTGGGGTATAIGEAGATVRRTVYVCASKTKIRTGFAMDSGECGVLSVGQRVEAMGYKVNDQGATRVRFSAGWVSEQSGAGSAILQVAPPLAYSVDQGGAVAYRKTPKMADRMPDKAQPGDLIEVADRVLGDGSEGEWVQNKGNQLWLPVRFLVEGGGGGGGGAAAGPPPLHRGLILEYITTYNIIT
jgi:hypothetical protein